MAAIKYKVELTEAERSRLNEVSQRGKASVRTVKRALSLLKADQGLRDREIADVLLVNPATVARARKRYVEEGLEAAINDRPWPGRERKLDGRQEAHLIAFACSAAPEGHTHWTLQLYTWPTRWWSWSLPRASPWRRCARYSKKRTQALEEERVVYPQGERGVRGADGGRAGPVPTGVAFVSRGRNPSPTNPERPVVCFDETSPAIDWGGASAHRGCPRTGGTLDDTEYQRNGTRNLFMICEPKGGWRHVEVTERRTAVDFAHQMRWLVDEAYPDAEVVRLVLDNLNTHQLGSLYEAFEPCEARRIAQRLEFHYTPTHGSWLNMAEIELSVFSRGCLNRRISDEPELRREVAALERERNAAKSAIDWRFTTQGARRKLQHIYPTKPD